MEAGFFTADQLRMIAEFVSLRGGGLLTLGGRHSFAEGGYAPTPLAEVLPIVFEDGRDPKQPFFAEMKVEPTPFGMTHGVTQLGLQRTELRVGAGLPRSPMLGCPSRPLPHGAIREMQRAAQLQGDAISVGRPQPLAVLGGELGMNGRAELAGDLAHSGGGVARVVMRSG